MFILSTLLFIYDFGRNSDLLACASTRKTNKMFPCWQHNLTTKYCYFTVNLEFSAKRPISREIFSGSWARFREPTILYIFNKNKQKFTVKRTHWTNNNITLLKCVFSKQKCCLFCCRYKMLRKVPNGIKYHNYDEKKSFSWKHNVAQIHTVGNTIEQTLPLGNTMAL